MPNLDYPRSEADLDTQPAAITIGDCVTPPAGGPERRAASAAGQAGRPGRADIVNPVTVR